MTNRYSVNAIYSLAAEQDIEVQDALGRAQIALRNLKNRISAQSKRNFVLERDVRYLDSRIALLIQNRIAADEKRQVQETLDDTEEKTGNYPARRKLAQYSNLFFLLQSEPRHMAALCRQVSYADFDTLMQTVMFTLYGNQYDQREEHLLLTMFQVSPVPHVGGARDRVCPRVAASGARNDSCVAMGSVLTSFRRASFPPSSKTIPRWASFSAPTPPPPE